MGMAMAELKLLSQHKRCVIGIDPYSLEAAMEGEHREEDRQWWATKDLEHIWSLAQEELEQSGAAVCTDLKIRTFKMKSKYSRMARLTCFTSTATTPN